MSKRYYYVSVDENILEGPFTFIEAERERSWYQKFGVKTKLLKLVVDEDEKEVK